ncbi:uncharacterized protein LOC109719568 isoform X2 [Ananas comosus]|uniref:Uncharacterized protein LOC109719568 isoform X2 n=1 Tax=Ananas comosus TaxID=4615 RepID=A0A6P5G7Z5_ANACO|nr:uncharacterized protein LOC109719568 isoform X2 [Ananas comosus]
MAPARSQAPPPAPPRTLNVQRFAESRAAELESLQAVVSGRLGGDFRIRRGKRRRTTGHRCAKRRRGGGGDGDASGAEEGRGKEKKVSRRVRRRRELCSNPPLGFTTSGDGTKRLRTHLWHAKRFAMVKRWGFYLPLGLQGRGRGSRAVLKWLKNSALVHDASYCLPIQLEGPEDSIQAILRMVIIPAPSEPLQVSENPQHCVFQGVCYENAMLYDVRPPHSQLVAPVMYMWQPYFSNNKNYATEQHDTSNICSSSGESERRTLTRKLWIWIHAAAFEEGIDALRFACQRQVHECGVSVSCLSLEGQLGKLEVMGSRAIELLQKILRPTSKYSAAHENSTLEDPVLTACTSSRHHKDFVLDKMKQLQSHAIRPLLVHDPREVPCQETDAAALDNLQEDINLNSNGLATECSLKNEDILSDGSTPRSHENYLLDLKNVWDSISNTNPPVPEKTLCEEKHQRRLKHFYLDSTEHETVATEGNDSFSRACPILLLKQAEHGSPCMGWSVILPLSWVKTFWFSLVSHGAHAIGLRERRWIACNNVLPSFPYDFPDCKAYLSFMTDEAAALDQAAELRPPAVRPLKVPIPPPWDVLAAVANKGSTILKGFELDEKEFSGSTNENSLINSSTKDGPSFPLFIPRTAENLLQYSESINGKNQVSSHKEPCLVRVLLRAYREGVFEEGAIICAPVPADLSRWKTRSEEKGNEAEELWQLQLPQSYVGSFFTQLESGNWELQLPKDHLAQEAFRWPIGFVTTGFVYGSNKRAAVAFCNANLLAILRKQQWIEAQSRRPEIFVLVRNMRSTSYRRALATVVLEQQKDDLEFL